MNNTIEQNKINGRLLLGMHQIFEAGAHRANRRVGKNAIEKESSRCEDGGYKCIHLRPEEFVGALGRLIDHQQIPPDKMSSTKFIDIGCGVGEKVYLASLFGLNAKGLELRRPLITEGKALFKHMGVGFNGWGELQESDHFIQGDALKHDYSGFDILYFYCPLCDHKLQCQLEAQIARTAKLGAVVLGYLPHGVFGNNNKDCPVENFEQNWKMIPNLGHRCWIRQA